MVGGVDVGGIVEAVVAVTEGPASAAAKGEAPAVATGKALAPAELQQGGTVGGAPGAAALRVEYHLG